MVGMVAGTVVPAVAGAVIEFVGELVSSGALLRQAVKRLAVRTMQSAIAVNIFMSFPPEIRFTEVVFPLQRELDWKKSHFLFFGIAIFRKSQYNREDINT